MMTGEDRTAAAVLALSLAILLLSGCLGQEQEKKPIRIAVDIWPGYADIYVAQEKGIFRGNGVEVRVIQLTTNEEQQEAYRNGEADAVFSVFSDRIYDYANGIKGKVVYVADYSDTGDVIAGDPAIRSVSELKGKRIGIAGVNTFSHIFVLDALQAHGLGERGRRIRVQPDTVLQPGKHLKHTPDRGQAPCREVLMNVSPVLFFLPILFPIPGLEK